MGFSRNNSELIYLAVPLAGMIVNIVLHIVIYKAKKSMTILLSDTIALALSQLGVIATGICLTITGIYPAHEAFWMILANFFLGLFLGYIYFAILGIGTTSLRIRMLAMIRQSPNGKSFAEMQKEYSAKVMLDTRIQRMIANGQIIERDGRYYAGRPVLVYLGYIFDGFKWLLLGKRSEY